MALWVHGLFLPSMKISFQRTKTRKFIHITIEECQNIPWFQNISCGNRLFEAYSQKISWLSPNLFIWMLLHCIYQTLLLRTFQKGWFYQLAVLRKNFFSDPKQTLFTEKATFCFPKIVLRHLKRSKAFDHQGEIA